LLKSKIEILLPLERHQNDNFFALFIAFSDVMPSGAKHLLLGNTPFNHIPTVQEEFGVNRRFAPPQLFNGFRPVTAQKIAALAFARAVLA